MNKRILMIISIAIIVICSIVGIKFYNNLYDGMSYSSKNRLVQRIYPNATLVSECIRDKEHNYLIGEFETTDNKAGFVVFEKVNAEKRIIESSVIAEKGKIVHHMALVNDKWEHIYYHSNPDIVKAEITITGEGQEPYTYTDDVCGKFFFVDMPEWDHEIEIIMYDQFGNHYE